MKTGLSVFILYVTFFVMSIIGTGCDDVGASPPEIPPIPCVVDQPTKYLRWQYYYMNSAGNNYFWLRTDATNQAWKTLYYRCNINSIDTFSGGRSVSYRIINTNNGSDTELDFALNSHADSIKLGNPGRFINTVCSIDSVSNDLQSDRVGRSGQIINDWSYLFTGKINRIITIDSQRTRYQAGNLVHELGHQAGALDHGPHTGTDNDRCMMNANYTLSNLYPYITFCERHGCGIYNEIDDTTDNAFNMIQSISQLDVTITLNKSNYIERESIILDIVIRNKGNQDVKIKNFNEDFVNMGLEIRDTNGNQVEYLGNTSTYLSDKYYSFRSGEEYKNRIFLLQYYGANNGKTNFSPFSLYNYFKVGNYKIKFSNFTAENEPISSNVIEFNINETKDEEKPALEELVEIYSIKTKGNFKIKMDRFSQYLYKYQHSVYIDQVLMLLIYHAYISRVYSKELFKDCKWFIKMRPNSEIIDFAINGIIGYFENNNKNNASLKKILKGIIDEYPSTKASIYAQQKLNEKFK